MSSLGCSVLSCPVVVSVQHACSYEKNNGHFSSFVCHRTLVSDGRTIAICEHAVGYSLMN